MSGAPEAAEGADDPDEARERAIRLLARREHAGEELRLKLRQRGFTGAAIDAALAGLAADGLQSDERFAEAYVHARRNRGHGPVRIRAELQQRGVPDELAGAALAGCDEDWAALAADVRRQRFGVGAPADARARQKQYRYLANRGFAAEHIRAALASEDSDDA